MKLLHVISAIIFVNMYFSCQQIWVCVRTHSNVLSLMFFFVDNSSQSCYVTTGALFCYTQVIPLNLVIWSANVVTNTFTRYPYTGSWFSRTNLLRVYSATFPWRPTWPSQRDSWCLLIVCANDWRPDNGWYVHLTLCQRETIKNSFENDVEAKLLQLCVNVPIYIFGQLAKTQNARSLCGQRGRCIFPQLNEQLFFVQV